MENIIINKIETKAMETALLKGQTPFALFKPAKGIPVLVKVTINGSVNNLLTPATSDDLKMSGKIDSCSTPLSDTDGTKSLQIKVPVVATVIEKIETDGKINFIIEPPGPEQEKENLLNPAESISKVLHYTKEYKQNEQIPETKTSNLTHTTTDEELLQLAATGGIQFVRAMEDGRYEIITNSEARHLMAQKSHDVRILGDEETEAINCVTNVHDDLDYFSTLVEDEIQEKYHLLQNMSTNFNDIIILDPNNDQKVLTLDDVNILEDRELKQILDVKCKNDRYESDIAAFTYLSQVKINEILNRKSINMDAGISVLNESEYVTIKDE